MAMERQKIKGWLWICWWNSCYQHQPILVRNLYVGRILKGRNGDYCGTPINAFFKKKQHLKRFTCFCLHSQQALSAELCRRVWTYGQEQCLLYRVYLILLALLMICTKEQSRAVGAGKPRPQWNPNSVLPPVRTSGSFPVCHRYCVGLTLRKLSVCFLYFH